MTVDNESSAPRSCRECGQDLGLVTVVEGGAQPVDPDLDWAEFCPSADCPVKRQDD